MAPSDNDGADSDRENIDSGAALKMAGCHLGYAFTASGRNGFARQPCEERLSLPFLAMWLAGDNGSAS
jgi:hypothetical protein